MRIAWLVDAWRRWRERRACEHDDVRVDFIGNAGDPTWTCNGCGQRWP